MTAEPYEVALDEAPPEPVNPYDEFFRRAKDEGLFMMTNDPPMDLNPANVYTALAAVQAELPEIAKDRTAEVKGETPQGRPYSYSYRYVDLATISAVVLPMLGRVGLAWVTIPTHTDKGLALKWELVHGASNTRVEGILPIAGKDPQALAGQITYYRRYALCAVVGVAAEEDDDAQRATAAIRSEREEAARNFDNLPKDRPAEPGEKERAASQMAERGRPPAERAQNGQNAPSVATDRQISALALRIVTVAAAQLLNAWRAVEAVNAAARKIDAETADKIAAPYADRDAAAREGLPAAGHELRAVMAWRLAEEVAPDDTTAEQVALVREVARAAYGTMGDPELLPGIKLSGYLGDRARQVLDDPPQTDHARTIAQEAASSWPEGTDPADPPFEPPYVEGEQAREG